MNGVVVTDPVEVPQICLVIELAQPRKEEDGSISPAEIDGIRSNLPGRYFDIRIVTPEDTTDEHGVYTGSTTTYAAGDDPHEVRAKYPFKVFDPHDYAEREPGKENEWVIGYRDGEKCTHCLVLGCDDIAVAIGRFREEHPKAKIWAAEQAQLDQGDDNPMGYLDRYEEILVVGGAKLQTGPGWSLRGNPN
jgi:hypothetical protein